MKERLIGALTINSEIYEEIKRDEKATLQAIIVMIVAAFLSAIGGGFLSSSLTTGFISVLVWAVASWLLWAGIAYILGVKLFHGQATLTELLRVVGFAYAPAAFNILSLVPFIGVFVNFLVAFWLLASVYAALNKTLGLEGGKTLVIVFIGWFIYLIGLGIVLSLGGAYEGLMG